MSTPNLGAGNSDNDYTKKFVIHDGQWATRVDEGTPDAIERTLKKGENEGKKVWELKYNFFAGYLDKVQIEDGDYGKRLRITMRTGEEDTAEQVILYVKLYSSLCRSFLNQLLKANPASALKLNLWRRDADSASMLFLGEWKDEKNDKGSNWWNTEMKYPWDKDNKGFKGLVEAVEIDDGEGGTKWSYQRPVDYLMGEVKTEILDHIQTDDLYYKYERSEDAVEATPKAPVESPSLGGGTSEEEDDLPF